MSRVSRKKKYIEKLHSKIENSHSGLSAWYLTAIYVRLSNEELDTDATEKIKNQKEMLLDYISDKPEYQLADTYCDNGFTGTNFDRPQWQRLMADAGAGKVNCIIVKDLSRLGRNYIEAGEYLEKVFPSLGIRFIAVSDGYDSSKPERGNTGMMIPLKNIINASYAKDLSGKISSARRMQRSRGEFTGSRVPYGYKKDAKQKGKFIVDEAAAKIIRMIFEYMAEGHSYSQTAQMLNRLQVSSPQGKIWYYQTIKVITDNEVYLGNMIQGKQCAAGSDIVRVENTHEAIIDPEIFEKVCKQKEQISYKRSSAKRKEIHLFQGLLVAANSGKQLVRAHYTRQRGQVVVKAYRSPKTYNPEGVPYKLAMIREEALITAIKTVLFRYIDVLSIMACFLKPENIERLHQEKLTQMGSRIQGKYKSLTRRKELLSDCYQDMAEGIITLADYRRYREKYREEITELEKDIKELKNHENIYRKNIALDNPYIALFREFGQTEKVTRALLELLVEKIIVFSSKEIEICFTFRDEFNSLQAVARAEGDEDEEHSRIIL